MKYFIWALCLVTTVNLFANEELSELSNELRSNNELHLPSNSDISDASFNLNYFEKKIRVAAKKDWLTFHKTKKEDKLEELIEKVTKDPTRYSKECKTQKWCILYKEIHFESPIDNSTISFPVFFYKYNDNIKRPTIVLSAPIKGVSKYQRPLQDALASAGYNLLIPDFSDLIVKENREIAQLPNWIVNQVKASKVALSLVIKEFPDSIDTENIFSMGTSMGGIRTSIHYSVDERVKATVLVVTGGNLHEILAHSKQDEIKDYRKTRSKIEGFAIEDSEARLKKFNTADPILFTKMRKDPKVLMLIGRKDTFVPTKNQVELWEAWGRPEAFYLGSKKALVRKAHRDIIAQVFKDKDQHNRIINFFKSVE